jgi:hypothetical protein
MLVLVIAAVIAQVGTFDGRDIERQFPRGDPPLKLKDIQKNKPIAKGDLEIDVVWAAVTPVGLMMNGGFSMTTGESYLTVVLRVVNRSDAKRLKYKPFGEFSRIADDVGNTYEPAKHERKTIVKHAADAQVMYPKAVVIDVLTFDRPVEKAKALTLTLAGSAVGSDDDVTFELPKEFVTKATDGEVLDATYFLTSPKGAVERRKGKAPKVKKKRR